MLIEIIITNSVVHNFDKSTNYEPSFKSKKIIFHYFTNKISNSIYLVPVRHLHSLLMHWRFPTHGASDVQP
jgi:hypothetical protein